MAKAGNVAKTPATATPAATGKKRNTIAAKHYITVGGDDPQKIVAESAAVEFRFKNGETRRCELSNYAENIQNLFGLYGIAQKLGDAYAGVDGDVDAAVENFDALNEQLLGGEWTSESRASGPRIGHVVEAWERILVAAGKPPTDAARDGLTALLKAGGVWPGGVTVTAAEAKAKMMARPDIQAKVAEIAAERAAERLKKLQEAAAATNSGDLGDMDFGG